MKKITLFIIILLVIFIHQFTFSQKIIKSIDYNFKVIKHNFKLEGPWGFDFLPNNNIIVTEKASGKIFLLDIQQNTKIEIKNMPKISVNHGQGGLLDIFVDPQFSKNRKIFITYTYSNDNKYGTAVASAILNGNRIEQFKTLFQGTPLFSTYRHFGSRIRMNQAGYLFISHGDRGHRIESQNLQNHIGSILRLNADGSIPSNNPFFNQKNVQPEIYSYGHRNPQGMALNKETGMIWISEHGAKGGDEINMIQAGKNYGWPIISYGKHYSNAKIGEGTHKDGMEQPIHYWDPSIAPAGMTFYSGKLFKKWKNNLFVTSLKFGILSRLIIQNNKVIKEEQLFQSEFGRIRDIKETSKGTLMFITDSGSLFEIIP